MPVDTASKRLAEELVAAYRPYVLDRVRERTVPLPSGLEEALAEGERWLERSLMELLTAPYAQQRRTPFELFQEAMSFPTQVLSDAGASPVDRDPVEVNALPGDLFGLAPAAASRLGEPAWRAQLEWGASKAQALAGARRVAIVSGNLIDRSRIEARVRAAGWTPVGWNEEAQLGVVDLSSADAVQAIERLIERGARVVGFGPHVDVDDLERAEKLGAEALSRSRFFSTLDELFAS